MRWSRRRGRDRWADLIEPAPPPNTERIADMQAEAAARAALTEPTVILENGVRIPAYLARVWEDETP
jgi:hypothetical protein